MTEFLTSALPLRPRNYFGAGSVEVSPPSVGKGGVRRLAITAHELVKQPYPGVRTVPDVVDYTVRTYGAEYKAVGWRDVITVHEDVRETSKIVDGVEVKEKKTWKLYELSGYRFLNYVEFAEAIAEVRMGLLTLGIKKEDVVNVYSQTSVNWQLMSHGCASISTAIATAYDTLGVDGLTHSINEPDCVAIFTNSDLLSTLSQVVPKTPTLKWVWYDGTPNATLLETMKTTRTDIQFMHLDELRALGRGQSKEDPQLVALLDERKPIPQTLACIMYTSGSTGTPKGVCITHENLVASVSSVSLIFGPHVPRGDIYLAYLPLAHVMEYIVELCALFVGVTCGYARPKTLTDAGVKGCRGDLTELRPNIMFGVPSVWETIRKGIVGKVSSGGAIKKALFYGAVDARRRGTPILASLGERVVLSKVRDATGGKLKFAMNGGAPISKDTQEFLSITVMPMMQGYGMTESCGMCTLLPPECMQFGVVGFPSPSIEIQLVDISSSGYLSSNPRPQGEIWIRGPSVSKGYYKRPDLNNDEEIYTKDGWFRTGDVGVWNEDGTLSLVDRVKNLVKMHNGEFIALEQLESLYKSCEYVSNICVHATSGSTFPIAVVFPHEVNVRHALSISPDPLQSLKNADFATITSNIHVKQLILGACNDVGKKNGLKGTEILGGIILTPDEWTPESGLVSAAMKVKRASVAKVFEKQIKSTYADTIINDIHVFILLDNASYPLHRQISARFTVSHSLSTVILSASIMCIPQEIIDLCIDEVAHNREKPEYFQALLSSSQTTRAINHRCRQHLFNSVSTSSRTPHVYPAPLRSRISVLEDLLEENNNLAAYIRHLHVDLGFSGSTIPALESHLPRVAEILVQEGLNLQSIEISARASIQMRFRDIPSSLQQSLAVLLKQPTLKTLKLGHLVAIPLSFMVFENLKHLYIHEATFWYPFPDSLPSEALKTDFALPDFALLKLHTLQIDRFVINFTSLRSSQFRDVFALIFSELETFITRVVGKSDVKGFVMIMMEAANSLRVLDLDTISTRLALPICFPKAVDVGEYPHLREVVVRLQISANARWPAEEYSLLFQLPSKPCPLSRVKIMIEADWSINGLGDGYVIDERGSSALKEFLTSPNLPLLREVQLSARFRVSASCGLEKAVLQTKAEAILECVFPISKTDKHTLFRKEVFVELN